ncbi:MAG: TonB-dependent receptor plug domain-containing protein [Polyangiaceae bacterium]|nr:TonB-dependent receptor plug domain-containing protein [Polyangiaceae bacterium]
MRRIVEACLVAMTLAASPVAAAQPTPATPPAPVIEMPKPITPLTAEYPAGAEGDAVVVLKLLIATDGHVEKAEPVDGKEPFLTAALNTAKSFQFVPAKRDGTSIRAAVRVQVTFTAPKPVTDSSIQNTGSSGTPTANTPSSNNPSANSQSSNSQSTNTQSPQDNSPPPAPEPIDVSVRGFNAPPGATTMSRAEVRLLPGAFGDPFRAVETLPGVTPIASGLPYFFVRGAPPGNVGYFLDGIRVPILFHLGLGPSVIHPAIVDRVDLYPGGYPSRFGRFAGAIVSGETRGPRAELNGEAQLRIVDVGAFAEMPFDGGRGSAMAGGRYSYTGLLFSLLQSDLTLNYWDYQARVSYDITSTDTLGVFAFGSRDYLGDKDPASGKERTLVDTTFHRVDVRHQKALGPGSFFKNSFTFGWDETGFDGGGTRDLMLASRSELRYVYSPTLTVRAGTDATIDSIKTTLDAAQIGGDNVGNDIPIALSTRYDFYAALWADLVWLPMPWFEVTPGVRADFYGSSGSQGGNALSIEPRIASVLHIKPWLRLVQAHGLASQRPSFFIPGPGFTPDFQGGLQRSFQTAVGVEADAPLDIEAKLTLFRSAFFDMTDAFGTSTFTDLVTPENYSQRSMGSSMGMEVSLRRRMTKRIGGFISYTLSESVRSVGRNQFLSGTNRTHVLNAAIGVDIWRGLRAGVRAVVYTGYPEVARGQDRTPVPTGRELPAFFRLDQRLEKKWTLGGAKWISLVLEMQNSTLTETLGVRCEETCEPVEIGPVAIPSIGLEGGI